MPLSVRREVASMLQKKGRIAEVFDHSVELHVKPYVAFLPRLFNLI